MINALEQIPTTEVSHPFCTAREKCHLREAGYIEEEYFLAGVSNVYGWEGEKKTILYKDAPYTNRLIVRKPERIENFSGNVVVEILNSTSFIDFDRVWVLTRKHLMRNGDIYIGITSKPNVIPAMLRFDHDRYHRLSWQNPLPSQLPDIELGNMRGASAPETEDGLFWDMLLDLAGFLRDPENSLLAEYGPYFQYLAGWSQSGAYMIRFLNDFAYAEERDVPLFDGYYSCGSASSCLPDLNQNYGRTAMEQSRKIRHCYQPFIEIHTESENQLWGNDEARGEDSDAEDMKYRVYDIPGASHDTKSTMIDYYIGDVDVYKGGIVPNYPGKELHPNDFPSELVFHAGLEMLYAWTREGIAPPVLSPIEVDEKGENCKDALGNSKGGWRLPAIEEPLCVYHTQCTPLQPDLAFAATLFGYDEPFPIERLTALHGDLAAYQKKISDAAGKCIEQGLLLEADKDTCIEYVVSKAREYGLR